MNPKRKKKRKKKIKQVKIMCLIRGAVVNSRNTLHKKATIRDTTTVKQTQSLSIIHQGGNNSRNHCSRFGNTQPPPPPPTRAANRTINWPPVSHVKSHFSISTTNMFSSTRALFSNIPCPYKEDCKLPRCLFLHSERAWSSLAAAASTSEVNEKAQISEDKLPRKHQKRLDVEKGQEVAIAPPPPVVALQKKLDIPRKEEGILATAKQPIKSTVTTRPISPPSRRKNAPNKIASQPSAEEKKAENFLTPKAKKALQAEELNPRAVTPSPAKHDIRYRLLKMLHENLVRLNTEVAKDDCSKDLVMADQALIKMALDMEESAAKDKPTIYSNIIKNKVQFYKKMSVDSWKKERRAKLEADAAKASEAPGTAPKKIDPPPKAIETGLSESHELLLLPRLYTDFVKIPQDKHGFVLTPPTTEMIQSSLDGLKAANNWECCQRCETRFQVFPGRRESDGALTTGGPCHFHWGKMFYQDLGIGVKGRGDRRYECCSEAVGVSVGCVKNEHHVYKVSSPARLATLLQYMETPENPGLAKRLGEREVLRPVCIDGEMVFTVHGLELVRLTATSWPSGSELLDILVRPFGEILDMNTRFSGIFPDQLARAKPWAESDQGCSADLRIVPSPVEARDLLCRLLTPKTPIIGHGLENDFDAIRLTHPTVIDTSILLPPKSGLPYRQSLKALMLTHLDRHIQLPVHLDPKKTSAAEDGEAKVGHDSKEDANSAGDLVRYLIGKEWSKMRLEGWSWINPSRFSTSPSSTSPFPPASDTPVPPTEFERHFVPPPAKMTAQDGKGLLTNDYLERDPTVQATFKSRRMGMVTGASTLSGGSASAESSEERVNRERAERRRKDEAQAHKRKLDEEIEREEQGNGAKRQRKMIFYDDLDGARDPDED